MKPEQIIMPDHTIHGSMVTIKGNDIYSVYHVTKRIVYKTVQDRTGDDYLQTFYTFGTLPLNTESVLLKQLRSQGKI